MKNFNPYILTVILVSILICGMAPRVKPTAVPDTMDNSLNAATQPTKEHPTEVSEAESRRTNRPKTNEELEAAANAIATATAEAANKLTKTAEEIEEESEELPPTQTPTPAYKLSDPEVHVWDNLRKVNNLLMLCKKDIKQENKFLRETADANFESMEKVIASMDTESVLHDRDKIEYVWQGVSQTAEHTLSVTSDQLDQMKKDIQTIKDLQKQTREIADKYPKLIQKLNQVEKEYALDRKEIRKLDKKASYLYGMLDWYVQKYKKIVAEKDNKVKNLIDTHNNLHKS